MPPAATASHLPSSGMLTLSGPKPMISMCNYTTSSSSSHRYNLSSGNRFRITVLPNRACVLFKESRSGSRLAWFRTSSITSSDHKGFLISAKKTEDDGGCDADTWLSALEVKPTRLDNPPAPVLPENPDLLKIPGVGPKNLTKLVENDISGVTDLKKIYQDKFSRKSDQKMIEFLQSSVGIKYRNHAKSIASFIKKSVSKEMKDGGANSDAIPAPKKKVKEDRNKSTN